MKKLLAIIASVLTLGAFAADNDITIQFVAPDGASAEKAYTVVETTTDTTVEADLDFGCLPYYIVATIAAEDYPTAGTYALAENDIILSEAVPMAPMSAPRLAGLKLAGEEGATINLARTNPVTGDNVTFTYYYAGSSATADQATDWNKADGTHPETVPDALGKGPYAPFIVDGDLTSVASGGEGYKTIALAPQEGWDFQVGAFNHVNLDLGTPGKIQGTSWFMIDATSKMVVDYSKGNVDGAFNLYVAGELTFTKYTQNKAASYYLKDAGVVTFTAAPTAGTHNLKQGDFKLSAVNDYKKIAKKYLVTFASGTKDFVLTGATITATDAEGGSVTTTLKTVLTTNDEVGAYNLGQDASGVYIAYVDYTDEEPVPETPTLIANGGTVDVSVASNWQAGKMPEAGDDILVIVKADSAIYVPSALTVGKMSVTGDGALTIRTEGSAKITASETVVDTDIAFQPAMLDPGLLTINEDKTASYYMFNDATLTGIRGPGTLDVYAGNSTSAPRTLTIANNASLARAAKDVTIKLHNGSIYFNTNNGGDAKLENVRFELDDGTSITQLGWVRVYKSVEVCVAEGSASAFTQSRVHNEGDNAAFVKTGAGTLEVNAAICTASATINAGTLIVGTSNNADNTAPITSNAGATVIKKGGTTATFTNTLTLNGGLEIQENGGMVLTATSDSVIAGVKGPGQITIANTGKLYLKNNDTVGYSVGGDAIININNAELGFGRNNDIVGSKLGDCTLVFNGGNATAYGWVEVHGTVVADMTQDGILTGNTNNRTQDKNEGNGNMIKRGEYALTWKSNLDLPVSVEGGQLTIDSSFAAGNGVITLSGAVATVVVPAKLADDKVVSGVTGYDVAFDGDTKTYSLVEASAYPEAIEDGSDDQKAAYVAWAAEVGISDPTVIGASEAFALKLTAKKIEDAQSVEDAVEKELDTLITADMVAELAAKAAEGETTVTIEGFENATFKFVPVEDIETTAKLFRLSVSFKPANSQN